jgi:hypothetical protein
VPNSVSTLDDRPPRIVAASRVCPETVDALLRDIAAALEVGHKRILVDLDEVIQAPLAAVSRFCSALRELARGHDASVAIIGGPPHLRRTVDLCAIERVELG